MIILKIFLRSLQVLALLIIKGGVRGKKLKKGDNLRCLLESLGPIFVKLGQSLSMRRDIVGDGIADSLGKLRDDVEGFDYVIAKQIIEDQLKSNINDVFRIFDEVPIAAASIAQVHRGILNTGEEVAIKVLRKDIEKKVSLDLRIMYMIANIFEFFSKEARRLKFIQVVELFENTCNLELDLRIEAAYAVELKEKIGSDSEVYIPNIVWKLTHKRVMVMEWINGTCILNVNENRSELAKRMAIIFFNQAYKNGLFHADMHAGNVLYDSDNDRIVLVDFGIVARLDEDTRINIVEILLGFLNRDYDYVAEVHYRAGYVDRKYKEFSVSCRSIGEPIVGESLSNISFANLMSQLFKLTSDFNMETRIELLMLQKSTILLEGMCSELDNNVNMWEIANKWMSKEIKTGITRKLCKRVNKAKQLSMKIASIVDKIDCILENMILHNQKRRSKNFLISLSIVAFCIGWYCVSLYL